jgi:hypothetical protein
VALDVQIQQLNQDMQIKMKQLEMTQWQAKDDSTRAWAQMQMQALTEQYNNQIRYLQSMDTAVDVLGKMGVPASQILSGLTGQPAPSGPLESLAATNNAAQDSYKKLVPGYSPVYTPTTPTTSQTGNPFLALMKGRAA